MRSIQYMDPEEYELKEDCQDYEDYGPQGYHPVVLGEKFNGLYTVVQKLGWGHFSTVWLVLNQKTGEYSALKIQRSKESHCQSAIDEMKILQQIRRHEADPAWIELVGKLEADHPEEINSKLCRPLLLLDNFIHHGIHGKHYCSSFELMGPNLLDVIQHFEFKNRQMPLWLVKKITRDVLLGLVYLHNQCGIVHTDLKPENIMIKLEQHQQQQLIEQIKAYKVKPISMKYLKDIQGSKNAKNRKRNEKKKLKKKLKKEGNEHQQEESNLEEGNNSEEISELEQPSSGISFPAGQDKEIAPKQSSEPQIKPTVIEETNEIKPLDDMSVLKWKNVKIHLNNKLYFKVVDLGNACFENNHFTEEIQTREYRAPQILLECGYTFNTDIWSLGCTVYEMITNNFLFKPDRISGIRKDEDHLFKMIEVLGPIEKDLLGASRKSESFFNKRGKLLHGHPTDQQPISKQLFKHYDFSLEEALKVEQFLLPMLRYHPKDRISAKECLQNPWLWN